MLDLLTEVYSFQLSWFDPHYRRGRDWAHSFHSDFCRRFLPLLEKDYDPYRHDSFSFYLGYLWHLTVLLFEYQFPERSGALVSYFFAGEEKKIKFRYLHDLKHFPEVEFRLLSPVEEFCDDYPF